MSTYEERQQDRQDRVDNSMVSVGEMLSLNSWDYLKAHMCGHLYGALGAIGDATNIELMQEASVRLLESARKIVDTSPKHDSWLAASYASAGTEEVINPQQPEVATPAVKNNNDRNFIA